MRTNVQKNMWNFGFEFSQYTPELMRFIESLMKVPWQKRIMAKAALQDPWICGHHRQRDTVITSEAIKELSTFANQDHVVQTLARLLTDIGVDDDLYPELRAKFKELDLNGDGCIGPEEFAMIAEIVPDISQKDMDKIMNKLDRNGNHIVDISEFISALLLEQASTDERLIRKAFSRLDKDNTGRLTKKDFFGVLRQYSNSISTRQVSHFVSRVDTRGDQMIDYPDFRKLFPQPIDALHQEIRKRFAQHKDVIELGPQCLQAFQDVTVGWITSLKKYRDTFGIACEKIPLPAGWEVANPKFSYERGHFSEFEIQYMIEKAKELVHSVPGYQTSKWVRNYRVEQQRKKERQRHQPKILGAKTLSMEAKKEHQDGQRSDTESEWLGESSADEATTARTVKSTTSTARGRARKLAGMQSWKHQIEKDTRDKSCDPGYRGDERVYEILYWLVKTKSDMYWQQPLQDIIDALADSNVDEMREFIVKDKLELAKLAGILNPLYHIREDTEFEADVKTFRPKVKLLQHYRMLPLGSMLGKDLRDSHHLEQMENMKVPTHFLFAYPKETASDEKIQRMKNRHYQGMEQAWKVLTQTIDSIEGLFKEVAEDLEMACCMEGRVPYPPNDSQLYLKHCDGRELQRDSATPRSNEEDSQEEDSSPKKLKSATTTSFERKNTSASFEGGGKPSSSEGEKPAIKKEFGKIERYHVLKKTQAGARSKPSSSSKK